MTPSPTPFRVLLPALACLVLAGCLLPRSLEPAEHDWRTMVTIHDFQQWLDNAAIDLEATNEELTKKKVVWTWELAYDYNGVDAGDGNPFQVYLHSEVSVHSNPASALHNANSYWLGMKAGLWQGGASLREVDCTIEWGDGLDCYTIHKGDRQIGNLLIAHSGKVATFVALSGLYSSDSALFERLLEPKLRALDDYDPSAIAEPLTAEP